MNNLVPFDCKLWGYQSRSYRICIISACNSSGYRSCTILFNFHKEYGFHNMEAASMLLTWAFLASVQLLPSGEDFCFMQQFICHARYLFPLLIHTFKTVLVQPNISHLYIHFVKRSVEFCEIISPPPVCFLCTQITQSSAISNQQRSCSPNTEMQKVIKIAELHFWPKKLAQKMAEKWPK